MKRNENAKHGKTRPEGLSIIIGTRNESDCIAKVIEEYASVMNRLPCESEIILADFSEDDTRSKAVAAAERNRIRLVPIPVDRPGRGYALKMGVEHAAYDKICLADGDGSHDPKYIAKMIESFQDQSIVMASRFPPLGWSEEHNFLHYYGNRIAVAVTNLLFHSNVTDVTNGFGLMTRRIWKLLSLTSNGWSFDVQIICRASKRGIPIIEIPSLEPKRAGGRAKLRLLEAFWRIGGRVLLERITR